jgi:general secretion pathway protein L
MRDAGIAARDRADFLGVYGGNRSALDLLAELSRRVPDDLEVKFEEVNIDRRIVRIKVFAKSFEAADRLTAQLAASEPFERAKVDGEVKASRRRQGKTFNVTIPLGLPGEES